MTTMTMSLKMTKDIDIYVAAQITMHLAFSLEAQIRKAKHPINPLRSFSGGLCELRKL